MNLLERTTKDTPENEAKIRGMEPEKYVFFRKFHNDDTFIPEKLSEKDIRVLLEGNVKDVNLAIELIKKGDSILTQFCEYYAEKNPICQSCKTHFDGKGELCPVCSKAMHRELDEVMETFPPGKERLNAIRGVKAGYGYKVY